MFNVTTAEQLNARTCEAYPGAGFFTMFYVAETPSGGVIAGELPSGRKLTARRPSGRRVSNN
jgi:hypothetical protein